MCMYVHELTLPTQFPSETTFDDIPVLIFPPRFSAKEFQSRFVLLLED